MDFERVIRIINRNTYTSVKKARDYCRRGLAEAVTAGEIRMLEEAELSMMRSAERDVSGDRYSWYVGDSGGSPMMKELHGVSVGIRMHKADRLER